ncbi:MAG: hypothetical protein C5B50_01790 [Verrucomicrobia bacterium]|nr:MAG: hypothetical protein C5B50_01790 [Verrucomicrobiota bacterium]
MLLKSTVKVQTSNFKFQRSLKLQTSNSATSAAVEVWSLEFIWSLEFGVWNFVSSYVPGTC